MTRTHQTDSNPITYRQEQITNENNGIYWRNKDTNKITFKKSIATYWIESGYRVYKTSHKTDKVLKIYNPTIIEAKMLGMLKPEEKERKAPKYIYKVYR